MSDVQDLHRATTPYRMSNLFKRRKWRPTVDEEGSAVERKVKGWKKIRVPWASKAARAGAKGGGPSALVLSLNRRDDDTPVAPNDLREDDAQVEELPEASEHIVVTALGTAPSSSSTRDQRLEFSSNSDYAQDGMPSLPASVDDEDLRVAQHHEAPDSIAACEAPRPRIEGGEQSPIPDFTPQPVFTSPPTPPPTLQNGVEGLSTAVQQPLNCAVTAVFSGAQSTTIENVYITVGHGNGTNLVAENVRWSMRQYGTSLNPLPSIYA